MKDGCVEKAIEYSGSKNICGRKNLKELGKHLLTQKVQVNLINAN